jgi:cytochrome d ubiquinol oxidase subunit I
MNVEILARVQFAFTIAFHYIYPPLSIGLGLIMTVMEALYLKTGKKIYERMTKFYVRIFALIFGIGVATGIVMEFEFGTNWAVYSKYVGDVFGSALAAEGIFAFALESGFLGGWNKVKPWVHFLSTLMVTLGSMFSAIWIVVANSWQQTPAGYHIVGTGLNARAQITDFWAMVFNPSSVQRLTHVWLGSFLSGAFLVLSISAYYLLKKRHLDFSQKSFKISLVVATICALAQLVAGHESAGVVSKYQPAKLAAFEGHYDSKKAGDMYLFGYVDQKAQQAHGLAIPGGLSYLVKGDFNQTITGLDHFKPEDRPKAVNFVFQTYHLMVAIGLFMIVLTLYASYLLWRGKIFEKRWLLYIFSFSVLLPQIANQVGWYSAEVGRQPWVVYGLLRTSKALSEAVSAGNIIFSLILFTWVYLVLFALFIYLLNKKIKHGPYDDENLDHSPRHIEMADSLG